MIQSYDLYLPTHLIFGKGRVTELARLIKGYGSKVLLTYGSGSVKRIGLYDTVREILHQEGCTVFELSGIAPNPKIESVREGVRIVKENGIDFIEKYCFDTDGRMFYEVTKTGTPVRKRRYVFSETFAAIAMAQYSIASGNKSYAEKAVKLFKQILYYKNTPGALEPKFREGFVAKGHSFCMILIDTAARIREAVDDPVLTRQIDESIAELRRDFMKPEFKAILETVGPNGEFIDSIPGRTINPGHSIETAWFILEEAKHRNWDPQLKQIGLTILNWSWEWGWDKTHGGITYFRDCKNRPQQEYWHDMKFWWPQCEAIIATLYAYEATGDPKYLEMHKQINEYTYARFPDKEYGEWFGYFHYDGTLSQPAKGNMYKGPFHIPRMLLKCHLLCKEIQGYDKQ